MEEKSKKKMSVIIIREREDLEADVFEFLRELGGEVDLGEVSSDLVELLIFNSTPEAKAPVTKKTK